MTNEINNSVIDLIANTPLVALDRLYTGPGRILVKCEFLNPGASMKDRTSLAMIMAAKNSGELQPGGHVVEMTSGNQGSGLALVCSVLGHPLTVTMSKGNSPQRAVMMRGLGANVVLVDQVNGKPGNVTNDDMQAAIDRAKEIASETDGFLVDQFNNDNNYLAHKMTTGPEIWRQTGGRIDAFLTCVGTGGTFRGTSDYLKEKNPKIRCIAVEPKGAEPLKGDKVIKPLHLLQGSGLGIVPPIFDFDFLDETISVSDEEAVEYRKLLGSKEGLYVGFTSAANVAAAVKLLKSGRIDSDSWVVTVLHDSGLKYEN